MRRASSMNPTVCVALLRTVDSTITSRSPPWNASTVEIYIQRRVSTTIHPLRMMMRKTTKKHPYHNAVLASAQASLLEIVPDPTHLTLVQRNDTHRVVEVIEL